MNRRLTSVSGRWAWLFLALSAAAVYPALRENIGALAYDVGTVHLYRSYVFSGAISDGVLYPRWVQFLHWGLGSPLFTFNPPLPYYALDLLYRLGLPHPIAWRVLIAAGLLAAAVGAYALVFSLTGHRWPAVVAGIAYLYAPYVLRNALERGSLETFSMFLYPAVLWGLIWVGRRPSAGRFVVASVIWGLCIGCHVLAPLMLLPFAGVLALLVAWRFKTPAPLLVLLAGVLLTAAIWLPIVPEQSNVRLDLNFENNFLATPLKHPIPLDRLLAPPVVYDVVNDNNGSGDRVGLLNMVLLVLGIPAAGYAWRRGRRALAGYLLAASLAGLLLFWMLTAASDPVWRLFEPILIRLEFRTRWMGLQALAAAVTGGLALAALPPAWQRRAGAVVAVALVVAALPSLYVSLQHRYGPFGDTLSWGEVRAAEIRSGGTAFTSWNEFAPRWRRAPFDAALQRELGPDFDPASRPLANPPAGVSAGAARVRSSAWDVDLQAAAPTTATLYLLYYPRWQGRLDGQPITLRPQPVTGYTEFDLPAGAHHLALRYGLTPWEAAGLALSGLTLLALLALGLRALWRRPQPGPLRITAQPARAAAKARPDPNAGPAGDARLEAREPDAAIAPPYWLLAGLTVLLLFKGFYVDSATTWLRCVSTAERVCGMQGTADVAFPGAPALRGYTVTTPQLSRGGELVVNLAWQANGPVAPRLRSFVHVRNSRQGQAMNPETGSEIWIQEDHETPGGLFSGEYLPGKIYVDEFRVPVPTNLPAGEYFLEVGWTNPDSGEQLDVRSETVLAPLKVLWRSVLLPSVQVR